MNQRLPENVISKAIYDCSFEIHTQLGPGLFESVYERILAFELRKKGLDVKTQVEVPVQWQGHVIEKAFKADLIVNGLVIVELKSVDRVAAIHLKQLQTYLKVADLRLGILANFGAERMKDGLHPTREQPSGLTSHTYTHTLPFAAFAFLRPVAGNARFVQKRLARGRRKARPSSHAA